MTWNGIRDTLLWMVVLMLIAVIAIGGMAARWWAAKDDMLTDIVRAHLNKTLPNCNVSFESARCIDLSQFEIAHLTVCNRESGEELVRVPRVVVLIDSEILRLNQRLVIRELVAHAPEAYFVRDIHHHWNWEGIVVSPPPSTVSPNWTVKGGAVRIGFESPLDGQTRFVNFQGIQVDIRPESIQRYAFEGSSVAEALGTLQVSGLIDALTGEWHVHGAAGDVRLGDSLLDLAARFSPQVHEQLGNLRSTNQALVAQALTRNPPQTAMVGEPQGILGNGSAAPSSPPGTDSLLRADMALQFDIGQPGPSAQLQYQVTGHVSHGQISELLSPLPLYDLDAKFHLTPELIEIRELRAANGESSLSVNGSAAMVQGAWAKNFLVKATKLRLDERVRNLLWGKTAHMFDLLSPSGTFNIAVGIAQLPGEQMRIDLEKFEAVDCRQLCDYFRYPVEHIHGDIVQKDNAFHINLKGEAAERPVKVTGTVESGPNGQDIDVQIHVSDFPIDTALRNALQRPEQQKVRAVLESLRLSGTARHATARVVRNAQTDDRVLVCIEGDLVDGTMNYTGFPYELTELSGILVFNPLERDTWIFKDLHGKHGGAQVSGVGFFDLELDPGGLALELAAIHVPLDLDLERATVTASPEMSWAWKDFGVKGFVDLDKVSIKWKPGTKCDVQLDGIHWKEGQFTPKSLPYQWNNVAGTLQWENQRLKIHSLHGDHNGTYLLINGAVADTAYVQIAPDRDSAWQLFLNDKSMHISKLTIDEELKRAVPSSVAAALESTQLKGTVNVVLGMDLKGWTAHPELLTASWSSNVTLKDNQLYAGTPLTEVTGTIVHRGHWDGRDLIMEGYGELDTVRALDMPLKKVQGPFLLKSNRLALGNPRLSGVATQYSAGNPYRQQQVRANLYGGQIGLDVELSLQDNSSNLPYKMELSINDVELGEWAREHKYQKLMGKVNGIIQTSGRGPSAKTATGQGWIQITPAALYELPVFVQMMTILSFRPAQPGDAAFNYAYADFTLHDEVFDFNKIELVGDALKFGGQGTVGYAGQKTGMLNLDFYSKAARRIPILDSLSSGWVRVQVNGTTSSPSATYQNRIPYLDEAFSGFMQSMESGQPRTAPRTIRPPTAQGGTLPN